MERLCAFPEAPVEHIRAFFGAQRKVADTLWGLFHEPGLLPPFGLQALAEHLRRSPRYASLLPLVGTPLQRMVERHGLEEFEPLVTYLNAVCQITVQAGVETAEAPFALAAMDYYFRGTGHITDGVGQLAEALVEAIRRQGGEVAFFEPVRRLEPLEAPQKSWQKSGWHLRKSLGRGGMTSGWHLSTRRREVTAEVVVANLLPQAVARLLTFRAPRPPRLARLARRTEGGWGAAMLYLATPPAADLPESAFHLELVADPGQPFQEGNHLFCSVSSQREEGRTPEDGRTVTVSTHVPMHRLREAQRTGTAADYIGGVQETMRRTLDALAPEVRAAADFELTASPRTFARFTGRPGGLVGGIPRRAGLAHYRELSPRPLLPGLYLAGDSVFPGQSTLAVALGGVKVAQRVARELALDRKKERAPGRSRGWRWFPDLL